MDFDHAEVAYTPSIGVRAVCETPLVHATAENLKGYGCLVEDPKAFPIEIVRWPAGGWRPVDDKSGDQGGVAEGLFETWWSGETLHARNTAVGDSYLIGWSQWPEEARADGAARPRERVLIWHANYHPDGGQLFYPLNGESFIISLALPGDDVTPEQFVTFRCDGGQGLYIHPGIWHEAVIPIGDRATFLDRQGRVHARVSVDFVKEFGCYLAAPLGQGTPRRAAGGADLILS